MKNAMFQTVVSLLLSCALILALPLTSLALDGENDVVPPASVVWDGTSTASGFHSGNGSFESPYEISTPEEFNYFAQYITRNGLSGGKYFILTSDLDFGGYTISQVGLKANRFTGIFDGCGHTISNFHISNSTSGEYVGLFGNINNSDAIVKNFTMENATITGGDNTSVGAIAGYLTNGTISNVTIADTVTVSTSFRGGIGGVVGRNYATIQYTVCNAVVNAECSNGSLFAGGLVGINGNGTGLIQNCISGGTVNVKGGYAGGFCGALGGSAGGGKLENCINLSSCSSDSSATGGLIGRVHVDAKSDQENLVINCINLSSEIEGPEGLTGSLIGEIAKKVSGISGCASIVIDVLGKYGTTAIETEGFEMTDINAEDGATKLESVRTAIAAKAAEEAEIVYGTPENDESDTSISDGESTTENALTESPSSKEDEPLTSEPESSQQSQTQESSHTEENDSGCASMISGMEGCLALLAILGISLICVRKNRKKDIE